MLARFAPLISLCLLLTACAGRTSGEPVSATGVDIANLRLSGIFDKTGTIPAGGEDPCFEAAVCGER